MCKKINNKKYIFDIFWTFKSKLRIILAATYIHWFFLTLLIFFSMFNTINPYLSLLFSHFVFLFSPSFSYSSRHETHSTVYNAWFDFGDKKHFIVHDERNSFALIITKKYSNMIYLVQSMSFSSLFICHRFWSG